MTKRPSSPTKQLLDHIAVGRILATDFPEQCIDGVEVVIPCAGRRPKGTPGGSIDDRAMDELEHVTKLAVLQPGKPGQIHTTTSKLEVLPGVMINPKERIYGQARRPNSMTVFLPTRYYLPAGQKLASVQDVTTILRRIWPVLAEEYVIDVGPCDPSVHLIRLDVTRDISPVARPQHVLDRVSSLPQHKGFNKTVQRCGHDRPELWLDPNSGAIQTVRVWSERRGLLSAYDKSWQDESAPKNTLRFELQCRTDALRKASITTLNDVDTEAIARLAAQWGLDRLAKLLSSTQRSRIDKLIDRFSNDQDLVDFVGTLACERLGLRPRLSIRAADRVRAARRALDIGSLDELVEPDRAERRTRLIPGARPR